MARIALDFGIVNIMLAAFNLIPIPPLDGSAVIERLLPARVLPQYYRMRFGFMIIVLGLVLFDQSLCSGFSATSRTGSSRCSSERRPVPGHALAIRPDQLAGVSRPIAS